MRAQEFREGNTAHIDNLQQSLFKHCQDLLHVHNFQFLVQSFDPVVLLLKKQFNL